MITVKQLLNIIEKKPDVMPIKFKWKDDDDFIWECDGISFPDKESVIEDYKGIGFFLVSDNHKEDWWTNCGNVKDCLLEFLQKGITFNDSIICYDTTVDERPISIEEKVIVY